MRMNADTRLLHLTADASLRLGPTEIPRAEAIERGLICATEWPDHFAVTTAGAAEGVVHAQIIRRNF